MVSIVGYLASLLNVCPLEREIYERAISTGNFVKFLPDGGQFLKGKRLFFLFLRNISWSAHHPAVLWIRIRSDRYHFPGSGSGSASRAYQYRSGAGLVSFSTNVKINILFSEHLIMLSKILKNMTPIRKINQCTNKKIWFSKLCIVYTLR